LGRVLGFVQAMLTQRAIAQQFSLATLYDAAILAVAELESAQFSTADQSLLNTLTPCPGYVQKLEA
jgi:predicted nucleic acid-binding protein